MTDTATRTAFHHFGCPRLRLTGITRHGKNRVHQHGPLWSVVDEGKFKGRDAWNLQSENETFSIKPGVKCFDRRWVLKQDDPNFEWKDYQWVE